MVELRGYRPEDQHWVVEANTRHYLDVEGFSADFAAVVLAAAKYLESQRHNPRSDFTIAEKEGRPVGCVFLAPETDVAARLRLFFVAEAARGQGVGGRMLRRLLFRARSNGVEMIRVSTFDRHQRACRLYRSLGFRVVADAPVDAFGQRMRQLDFEFDLANRAP